MNGRTQDVSMRPTGIQKVGRPCKVAHEAKQCTRACCEHELQHKKNLPQLALLPTAAPALAAF